MPVLGEQEKVLIWHEILENEQPDDIPPRMVIEGEFMGDEEAYLLVMGEYHDILSEYRRCLFWLGRV